MLVTDIGFVLYWLIILFNLLPEDYLYKDYDNEMMVSWNLSFIPLDLLISITGLTGIYLFRTQNNMAVALCIISLTLTSCSGLQAIVFWAFRGDFDITWWIPNVFLLIYPLFFLPQLVKRIARSQ
ncbi:hypothetical protein D3C84_981890 [compost metagenome]